MPVMPRMSKKAKKIAYGILGKPANIAYPLTPKQKEIQMRTMTEQTAYSK